MLLIDDLNRVMVLENAGVISVRQYSGGEYCVHANTAGSRVEIVLGIYPTKEIADKLLYDMVQAYERGDAVFRFPSKETVTHRAMPEMVLNYCKSEGTSEE